MTMTNEIFFYVVDAGLHGLRLDKALTLIDTGMSLRAAKRLIERGTILVNDRVRDASFKVRQGQRIQMDAGVKPFVGPQPFVIRQDADFAAIFKPTGLHSVRLAGSSQASLEDFLPELFPLHQASLINRLDQHTSGIVMAAFSDAAIARFRDFEEAQRIEKRYLAMVEGDLAEPVRLAWMLETADRDKVKPLPLETNDPLRATQVTPIARLGSRTLVEANIAKGARHQIRVHLAVHGYPIVGDALYGQDVKEGQAGDDRLYLHHWRLKMEGFQAWILPEWDGVKAELEQFAEAICGDG